MREINFSIPSANKASVGITTALYDRRALDCTSTLPLVNSLNHLAYLTTSSARIRDILTVDGGVERLICILKEGRSKDMMEMWKWNLAFQCVVNIGVRGSEHVRTRVVQADMVPVIATILDNYIKVSEKQREKADAEMRRNNTRLGLPRAHRHGRHSDDRSRRHVPAPIDIPPAFAQSSPAAEAETLPAFSLSSPPERTTFGPTTASSPAPHHHHHHHHHRSHGGRVRDFSTGNGHHTINQPLLTAGPVLDNTRHGFATMAIPPVREVDRLPSMLPSLQAEIASQPQSPSTPNDLAQLRTASPRRAAAPRRPSIRHQVSTSGDSDDNPADEIGEIGDDDDTATVRGQEPVVTDIQMQDIVDADDAVDPEATPVRIAASLAEGTDTPAFNLAQHNIEGSIANPATPQPATPFTALPQVPINLLHAANTTPPTMNIPFFLSRAHPFNFQTSPAAPELREALVAAIPREEDVLMSLQLLAYVSKYCSLRQYFQNSHLVPGLKIGRSICLVDGQMPPYDDEVPLPFEDDPDNEFLLPEDFNIFPVVERFTVRHHSQDMQYWAGVVMRNLCRKDDSRGGIRQCAWYKCGRWEEYTRQFAKCRRCRRTKYCSKECQKSAWVFHRHWCVAAQQ